MQKLFVSESSVTKVRNYVIKVKKSGRKSIGPLELMAKFKFSGYRVQAIMDVLVNEGLVKEEE